MTSCAASTGRERCAALAEYFVEHAEGAAGTIDLALDEGNVDQHPLMPSSASPLALHRRQARAICLSMAASRSLAA